MQYLSLFSGVGGFELGIQRAYRDRRQTEEPGLDEESAAGNTLDRRKRQLPTCIGYSEIDKYAIQTYEKNWKGHKNYGDATRINPDELPDFDLLVGGFPCQAFSIAGKRKGFDDTRGTLFFDIARILQHKRPQHILLENVKGLLSHDSGKTLQTIAQVLSELGYRIEWQVLNAKDFGVPQNRERIFIVGHLRGECAGQVFPIAGDNGQAIEVIGYLNSPTWQKRNESIRRVYSPDGSAPTLPTGTGGGVMPKVGVDMTLRSETGYKERSDGRVGTLDANYYKGIANQERPGVKEGARIRRLTPTECERLMSWPDGWTIGSDTQRYKQCGNGVVSNVVQAVIEKMKPCLL